MDTFHFDIPEYISINDNNKYDNENINQNITTNVTELLPKYVEHEINVVTINNNNREAKVFDVACYLLLNLPNKECTTMKLHKLLYYCQAWSMVWEEKPIFPERIEAWINGPVIRELFSKFKGYYTISYLDVRVFGNDFFLTKEQKETVDEIIKFYGDKPPYYLVDLTHFEDPWKNARIGLAANERGNREITLESMQEYYSSL